jgi:lysophospholipid acyltransferase (LPLAT)-like uncharacterized protein
MKLRHPALIGFLAFIGFWIVRFWMGTIRCRLVCLDGKKHPTDARLEPHIYAFWHEAVLFPTLFKGKASFLISQHTDGELIARVCKHLGGGVVRGSTTRGGMAGLMAMANRCQTSHLLITPDGPRGPRRQCQYGAVLLASLTGVPLVPVGLTFGPTWRASSWDKMLLPKPWGTAYGVIGVPVYVPPSLGRPELEQVRRQVENEMIRLTIAAERWARERVRPTPAPTFELDTKIMADTPFSRGSQNRAETSTLAKC